MDTVEQDIAIAQLRGRIYGLLTGGFKGLTEEYFQYLRGQYIPVWHELVQHIQGGEGFLPLLEKMQGALDAVSFDVLYGEYYNLFMPTGMMLAIPSEMEYVNKETPQHSLSQQAQLADIAGFYRAFGLDVATNTPERVDHITTELEYMHVMALKEATALANNDAENACIVVDAQRKFITDHLGRWADKFSERLVTTAGSEFYAALGETLALWINIDKQILFDAG
ncbi:MAG: molecular chaperone TorD family protein [Nitrospirae bacterium]|uniref:TorD/DmsD family molecular chaperone n=1 Tax=Candidatus Magnetobacterium casense TaxID=1455061 RepID=UPI0006982F9D|nr:molecular chaperone TorD family protein [Candidatus Magnetobacterium casensis]MBF0336387.1 molecular chaperone TorD family protein [Nitrospirota bacterium]